MGEPLNAHGPRPSAGTCLKFMQLHFFREKIHARPSYTQDPGCCSTSQLWEQKHHKSTSYPESNSFIISIYLGPYQHSFTSTQRAVTPAGPRGISTATLESLQHPVSREIGGPAQQGGCPKYRGSQRLAPQSLRAACLELTIAQSSPWWPRATKAPPSSGRPTTLLCVWLKGPRTDSSGPTTATTSIHICHPVAQRSTYPEFSTTAACKPAPSSGRNTARPHTLPRGSRTSFSGPVATSPVHMQTTRGQKESDAWTFHCTTSMCMNQTVASETAHLGPAASTASEPAPPAVGLPCILI